MDQCSHRCPKPKEGWLPSKVVDAVTKGDTKEVQEWLKSGGDINAADDKNQTLLFLACSRGNVGLVRWLLQHSELHLHHFTKRNMTPLRVAAVEGHLDCVEALLSSAHKCQMKYGIKENSRVSVILKVAQNKHWSVVEKLLELKQEIDPLEISKLLITVTGAEEWKITRDIVESEIPPSGISIICHILGTIYAQNKWEEVSAMKLFREATLIEHDHSKKVLRQMFDNKDWRRLEDSLRVLSDAVKLDVSLAEAVSAESSEEIERLLAEEQTDIETVSGTLLVAAIGGTNENIASLLLSNKHDYPSTIIDNALILSCLNNSSELLPLLMQRRSFGFKTLTRALGVTHKNSPCRLLMEQTLKKQAQLIIPLSQEEEDEDDNNESDDDSDDDDSDDTNDDYDHSQYLFNLNPAVRFNRSILIE